MTTVADEELTGWIDDWQAEEGPVPAAGIGLRRRVRRRSHGLVALAVTEAVMSLVFAGLLARLALRPSHPADVPMAIALLGVIALAFGLSFWNRRGLWRPQAGSLRQCIEVSLRRARRRRAGLAIGWLVLGLETLVLLPWLVARVGVGAARGVSLWPFSSLALLVGIAALALLWIQAWTRREITELEALQAELSEE